jgi:hypothetical protein
MSKQSYNFQLKNYCVLQDTALNNITIREIILSDEFLFNWMNVASFHPIYFCIMIGGILWYILIVLQVK